MKDCNVEFKTLLTKTEYMRLCKKFSDKPSNLQINYYFDTPRFTLKASDIGLRVRKRDKYEINLKRKKGYQLQEIDEETDKILDEVIDNEYYEKDYIRGIVNEDILDIAEKLLEENMKIKEEL